MSIFRNKATSKEIVVCDGCGITEHNTKLDPLEWEKVDFTSQMLAKGFPEGTALDVTDCCPMCAESKT
jgi:hypothetical protein